MCKTSTPLKREDVRKMKQSIDMRRKNADMALQHAKAEHERIMRELTQEEENLQRRCPHSHGTVESALRSHSNCPDCGLEEFV